MGSFFENIKRTKIWQTIIVYLGGAWVFIEALDFLSRQYGLSSRLIDIAVIIVIIGLPLLITNNYFRVNDNIRFNVLKQSVIYSVILIIGAVSIYRAYNRKAPLNYNIDAKEGSIAVLTFDNFSVDKDNNYLAAGIAEAIRNELSHTGNLKVISRNSIEQFQKLDLTTPQIGSKLGVKYVLDGSIQKFKQQIRITIELLDANEDIQVWSESYERDFDDLLALQSDIAADVTQKLRLTVSVPKSTVTEFSNIEAYELYLEAMERVHLPSGGRNELKNTIALFDKVLEMEPNFAHAYLGKAQAYLNNVAYGRSSLSDVKDITLGLIMKAMELNNGISECYSSLGFIYYQTLNFEKAIEYFNKSISLNPNNVIAYLGIAEISYINDDFETFNKLYDYAISLDPLVVRYPVDKYGLMYYATKDEKYISEIEKIAEKTNNDYAKWCLAMSYSMNNQYDEAIQIMLNRNVKGADTNWGLGYTYASKGEKEKAIDILNFNLNRSKETYVPPFMISVIYIGLKDYDSAMDWLEKEYEEGPGYFLIFALKSDPKFDPLVDNPRYQALLKKVPYKRIERN